jgi:hypothetical protein
MRLPIALATLFVATTVALPAFAATPAPIGASLRDAAVSQIETIQNRQTTPRQRRQARNYRGYNAYAAEPRARRDYYNPWGNCVRLGPHTPGRGAFPSWDIC